MHSHRRPRGKTAFEVLCAASLAASFVAAWDQTGVTALLASASIVGLFALYWSAALFAREAVAVEAVPSPVEFVPQPEPVAEAPRIEIFPFDPEPALPAEPLADSEQANEPELVVKQAPIEAKPKRRSKKSRPKAEEALIEQQSAIAAEESVFSEPVHIEQLFDPQPFARQPRPAFGRKSRGPRPLPAA